MSPPERERAGGRRVDRRTREGERSLRDVHGAGDREARAPRVDRSREAGRRGRERRARSRPWPRSRRWLPWRRVTARRATRCRSATPREGARATRGRSRRMPPSRTQRRRRDDEVRTHPCSLRTPDCNPASRAAVAPTSTDARCSLTVHARPRARRGGPARRASPRRLVRRAVRRGEDRRRRSAWTTARSRSSPPGSIAAPASASAAGRRTATRTRTGWTATRCWPRPRPRAPRSARASRAAWWTSARSSDPAVNPVERPADGVAGRRQGGVAPRGRRRGAFVQPRGPQVVGVYGDSLQRVLIATSDGRWVEESRPRIRLVAQVVAARDGNIQTGFHGPAACSGRRVRRPAPAARPRPRSPRGARSRCSTRSRRRRAR